VNIARNGSSEMSTREAFHMRFHRVFWRSVNADPDKHDPQLAKTALYGFALVILIEFSWNALAPASRIAVEYVLVVLREIPIVPLAERMESRLAIRGGSREPLALLLYYFYLIYIYLLIYVGAKESGRAFNEAAQSKESALKLEQYVAKTAPIFILFAILMLVIVVENSEKSDKFIRLGGSFGDSVGYLPIEWLVATMAGVKLGLLTSKILAHRRMKRENLYNNQRSDS
jgi:hypothetical protein